jgi:16S rRNA U516 pseudouridylate synthase RsuA-like enzyme
MQGYLCSVSAPEGEGGGGRLVLDLLAPWLDRFRREHPRGTLPPRLFPVGRLDVPSVGLLFVTNDGEGTNVNAQPPAHGI